MHGGGRGGAGGVVFGTARAQELPPEGAEIAQPLDVKLPTDPDVVRKLKSASSSPDNGLLQGLLLLLPARRLL
eukprot:13695903-Alexandrium_andersonii.AAC.1